jgi:hypothetical protein
MKGHIFSQQVTGDIENRRKEKMGFQDTGIHCWVLMLLDTAMHTGKYWMQGY